MSNNPVDTGLLQTINAAVVNSVDDVITTLSNIDGILPSSDGLKWFNLLYLMTTKAVRDQPPQNGWQSPQWSNTLDVAFAHFYFVAITEFLTNPATTPSSWQALFESRNRSGVERIQFAVAGTSAHVNHDLAVALLETNDLLDIAPDLYSPEHDDFEHVNTTLEAVFPQALRVLADGGPIGEIAQDTGRVGLLLAIWNLRQARNLAWDFSAHLRNHRSWSKSPTSALTSRLG
jgi:hypothetical protein